MREILFKAKRKGWEKALPESWYVEGYYAVCPFNGVTIHMIIPENLELGFNGVIEDWVEIEPETLCQYTGKTDHDGKKIFENDVLVSVQGNGLKKLRRIVWDDDECAWAVEEQKINDDEFIYVTVLSVYNTKKLKVVGNKFDDNNSEN